MKKALFVVITIVAVTVHSVAQTISYDASTIPAAMKKDANVIKRYENILFEVTDIDRAVIKTHQVFTVLNADGKDVLAFGEGTDKFTTLGDVDIKVYDEKGKSLQKYKRKDLATTITGEGLVDDGKIYYYMIPASSYPLTVEYIYEMRYKGTLHYPRYEILVPGQGVEYSAFTARVPKDLDLRFKEKNIKLAPQTAEEGKYKTYTWTVKNLEPIAYEEGAVSYESRYPSIVLAPNRFKMDDYEGDMSSWKSFGKWYASLKKGIDVLSDNKKQQLKELVKNAKDDRETVQIIYQYMQKNFRYVSIQLGIGGFKPFPADFTDNKKYGDCKALSNYMQAALDAVGIKSYQALINATHNKEPVDPNFPCDNFNHVILCVPLKGDSIWLECTSKTADFGVLGSFTENRNALLITDVGGVLIPTPASKSSDNKFMAITIITLSNDGSGKTNTHFTTTGEYKEDMNTIINEKKDDQKESIVYYMGFKQPDEFMFSKEEEKAQLTTTLAMEIEKVPEFIAGSKMFISPRLYKLWSGKLPKAENRKLDFYFVHPFEKTDTTIFKLPDGFVSDALPKSKELSCKYATYTTKYWYDQATKSIYSSSQLVLKQYRIPAADYASVKQFFDDVLLDDTQRIVVKKE